MIAETTTQTNVGHLTQQEAKEKDSGTVRNWYAVATGPWCARTVSRSVLPVSSSRPAPSSSSPSLRVPSGRVPSATPSLPAPRTPLFPGHGGAATVFPPSLIPPISRAALAKATTTHGSRGSLKPLPPPAPQAKTGIQATKTRRRQTIFTENLRTGRSASSERCSPGKNFLFTTNKQNPNS